MLSVGNYINARSIELETELRTDHGNGQKRWAIKNRPLICPFSYDTGSEKRVFEKKMPRHIKLQNLKFHMTGHLIKSF